MPEIKQLNISDDIIPALDQSLSANTYTYTNGVLYVEAQDTQLYNTRVFTFGRFHGVIFDVTYPYDGPSLRVQLNAPGDQLAITMTIDAGGCSVISGWVGSVTGTYGTRTDNLSGRYRYVRISRNRYVIEGFTGGNDYIFVDVSNDKQTWQPVAQTGEMANPSTLDDDGWNLFFEFSGNIYLGPILGVDVSPYALPGAYDFKLRTPNGWLSVANAEHPLKLRLPDNTWATLNNRERVPGPKLWLRQDSDWLFVASGQIAVPQTVRLFGQTTLNGTVAGNDLVVIGPYKGQYRAIRTTSSGYRFLDIPVTSFPADIPIRYSSYSYAQTDHVDTVRFSTPDQTIIKNYNWVDPYTSVEHGTGPALKGLTMPYTTAWQATRSTGATTSSDAGPRGVGSGPDTPGSLSGQQISARATIVEGTSTETAGWIAVPIAAYMQQALHNQHFYSQFDGLTVKRISVYIWLYGNSGNPTLDSQLGQAPASDVVPGLTGRVYYQGPLNSPVATWTWHDDDYPAYDDHTLDSPYTSVVGKTFAQETTGDKLYDGPLNVLSWSPSAHPNARAAYVMRHELPADYTGISAMYHINVDPATPGPDGFTNDMTADFSVEFDMG